MGIQPELIFFLVLRSTLDSKSVHFYSMNEKYGYKNLYKIVAITQYLGVVTVNVIGIKMPLPLKKNGGGEEHWGTKILV